MDCQDYTTCQSERERGQHLGLDDRGAIQQMHRLGYSNRAIARAVKCSPTTVGNELCRGTPERQPGRRGPQTRVIPPGEGRPLMKQTEPVATGRTVLSGAKTSPSLW